MELRHLRYFVMAAEEGNISRASARLNVSQPAVSRQTKDLEEELAVQLFNREPTGLSLTGAGRSALAHAREILRHANTMMEAMEALFPGRRELMEGMFAKAGISAEVAMRASGLSELLGIVGGGAGVAFLDLKKPRRVILFSAEWRKTGDLVGILSLVRLIQQESGLAPVS